MASDIIIKCPKCEEDFEIAASKAISVECPHCSKKVIVPPEFRRKGGSAILLVLFLLLLLLGGGVGTYYIVATQRVADEKKAKIIAKRCERIEAEEAALAKKAEEWVKVLDSTREESLLAEDDFKRAMGALLAFQKNYPRESGYTSVLKEKLLRLRRDQSNAVIKLLTKKTAPLVDEGDFTAAADIYTNFSGDFADDTSERRSELAEECREKAESVARAAAEKERLAKERRDLLIKEVVAEMTKQRYEDALAKLRSSNDDSMQEVVLALSVLSHISDSVLKSFKNDVGKKVTIELRQGQLKARIKKVKNGAVFADTFKRGAKVSRRLAMKDLGYNEIADRLFTRDKLAGTFFKGIVAMKKREYASAEKFFNATGPLAPALLHYLSSMKEIAVKNPIAKKKNESKKLKKLNYNGAVVDVKVSPGKKTNLPGIGKKQSFIFRYAVKNMTGEDLMNCTLAMFVIGESVVSKNSYKFINQTVVHLNLKKMKKLNSSFEFTTEYQVDDEWDGDVASNCFKYVNWICALKSPDGTIKKLKTRNKRFRKVALKILALPENTIFDKNGEPLLSQ